MDNILNLIDENLARNEIIEILKDKNSEDFRKIFAIINLDNILSQEEFNLLISYLTDNPTPLREITAIKLDEFSKIYPKYYLDDYSIEKILKGIIDINPNISRAICNTIEANNELQNILEEKIIQKTQLLLEEIKIYEKENKDYFDKHIRNTKNHAKNKKLFSLYWYLESLSFCISQKNNEKILNILTRTINFLDYTIREKTAKILTLIDNPPINLVNKIKQDLNFYVKNQVYDKITIAD